MKRIAVIGSGVSGLGAAWALSRTEDVTVFEAQARAGGHANTRDIVCDGRTIGVDTGFLVYNEMNYPHLVRLLDHLGVETEPSDMSFAVSMDAGRLEYRGSLAGMFAQKRNILRPRFWSMIRDTLRFFDEAPQWLSTVPVPDISLGTYLAENRYGRPFIEDHLVPMAAAIWSCPDQEVLDFPASSFLTFLSNHGLLRLKDRPQWRTVRGGSRHYVQSIARSLGDRLRLGTPVRAICRDLTGVHVTTDMGTERFDELVMATHADQAMRILGHEASSEEREILGSVRYSRNDAWLHCDPALMPSRRKCWSSWNYIGQRRTSGHRNRDVSVTYWLNRLQNLAGPDVFVSLNPVEAPAPDKVFERILYDHPIFDAAACAAQERIRTLQGVRNTWYCGSYLGYGFHEDGLESGFAVADSLGAPVPWRDEVVPASPADGNARPDVSATMPVAA